MHKDNLCFFQIWSYKEFSSILSFGGGPKFPIESCVWIWKNTLEIFHHGCYHFGTVPQVARKYSLTIPTSRTCWSLLVAFLTNGEEQIGVGSMADTTCRESLHPFQQAKARGKARTRRSWETCWLTLADKASSDKSLHSSILGESIQNPMAVLGFQKVFFPSPTQSTSIQYRFAKAHIKVVVQSHFFQRYCSDVGFHRTTCKLFYCVGQDLLRISAGFKNTSHVAVDQYFLIVGVAIHSFFCPDHCFFFDSSILTHFSDDHFSDSLCFSMLFFVIVARMFLVILYRQPWSTIIK